MIKVERLGIQFGKEWIFRDIHFAVKPRESIVFLGPSGSGKSVLLKTLAGLLPPSEGKYKINSDDLGMLFQKNALFDSLNCIENLLFPLKERRGIDGKEAFDLASKMLESVGLKGNEKLFPDEISGGMQKRLGIARALIVRPQVILYDEPTAGLDPITSRIIADLILELRKTSDTTVLTVINDVQRAYQLADRIFFLAQGRLIESGSPDETRNSHDPIVRQFIRGDKHGPLTTGL